MAVRMTGLISGLDTESIVKELMTAQRTKQTKIKNNQTKLEWKQDKWKELNTKIYKFYTDSVSKMRLQGTYLTKKVTSTNEQIATATAQTSAASGAHTLEVTNLASSQYVTGNQVSGMTSSTTLTSKGIASGTVITISAGTGDSITTKTLTVGATTTVNDLLKKAQDAGLNASFDETQDRFFIGSKTSGEANEFSITSSIAGSLQNIGLTDIDLINNDALTVIETAKTDGVALVAASNAEIILDGATLTGTSNNFTAAGITFNLLNKPANGEKVVLTVTDDTQATYDTIKEFISSYNTLLEEMNDQYYADSARGYEPLSDEEKEAMTEDQIEKWETKIKDSLLRRDSTLGNLINAMKSSLAATVKVGPDGSEEDFSLASYGIYTSSDYTEKGLLHIYGNSEDSIYADKKDYLKTALEENPDQVLEAFTKVAKGLYETMADKMKTSSLSSALTYYNDKEITKQLATYSKEISDWDDRLQAMETRYYKQFSAMETAMKNLETQSSALSSLLGTTTE